MIEISEVINWMQDDERLKLRLRRGPNAIVVMADFYDNELNQHVFQLPDEEITVVNTITEVMDALVDTTAEACKVDIMWGVDAVNENQQTWGEQKIQTMGKEKVVKALTDLLKKNFEGLWIVSGYQAGDASWEVEYRRYNFG